MINQTENLDIPDFLNELFSGSLNDFGAQDEYSKFKKMTDYRLVKLKSGNYGITKSGTLLKYRHSDINHAKRYFIDLCKIELKIFI